jgi:hypothetical protein
VLIQFKYRAAAPLGSPPAPVQTVQICSGSDVLLSGFKHGWARNVAVEEFFRGNEVKTFDRKNHRTELAFQVARVFPTLWQARQEMLLLPSTLASTTGYLQLTNDGAGSTGVNLFCKGAITSGDCYHLGVTVFQSYTFIGGKMLTAAPTL